MFYLRRKIPVMGLYYITKAIGTKGMRDKVWQLKDAIDKCEEIGKQFEHFTKNEWIFDTKNTMKILEMLTPEEKQLLNFDVMRIKWKMLVMNHAYGIKKFILKEEAELPSVGYNDVVTVSFSLVTLL